MTEMLEHVLEVAKPSVEGRVARVVGLNLEIDGLQLPIGASVHVHGAAGDVVAEVVAVHQDGLVCMPLGELRGVRSGDPAARPTARPRSPSAPRCSGVCSTASAGRSTVGRHSTTSRTSASTTRLRTR